MAAKKTAAGATVEILSHGGCGVALPIEPPAALVAKMRAQGLIRTAEPRAAHVRALQVEAWIWENAGRLMERMAVHTETAHGGKECVVLELEHDEDLPAATDLLRRAAAEVL